MGWQNATAIGKMPRSTTAGLIRKRDEPRCVGIVKRPTFFFFLEYGSLIGVASFCGRTSFGGAFSLFFFFFFGARGTPGGCPGAETPGGPGGHAYISTAGWPFRDSPALGAGLAWLRLHLADLQQRLLLHTQGAHDCLPAPTKRW